MSRKTKRGQSRTPVPEQKRRVGSPLLKLAAVLFGGAAAMAAYLFFYAITEKPMAGCGPGSPCDRVMGSSWAYWLNIPVSGPALATYLLLVGCAIATFKRPERSEKAWKMGLVLSLFVVVTAIWFVFLQVEVLKSVCKFCTATHLLGITGAIIFLLKADRPAAWRFSRTLKLALVAFAMFGSVIAGQKLIPHKTNLVSVYDGRFKFDLRDAPIVGKPDNDAYIISLFDYTCPDCHGMHALLKAAREQKNNSFSIISLPVPLDANCNPTIRETRPKHKDACVYAKIGLAVRRCGSDLYQQYDEWFFASAKMPTLEVAREKAESLAGKDKLANALADPWVEKTLREGISVYEHNGRTTRSYRMPQLVIGDSVVSGQVSGLNELIRLLDTKLRTSSGFGR